MIRNWYVVVHRAGARIFEQTGVSPALALVASFDHPEGRMREGELTSDRPGKIPQTMGTGFHQYSTEHSARDLIADRFVRVVTNELASLDREGKFDQFVLVANPQLLGKLREELDEGLLPKLRTTLVRDLGHVPEHGMAEHLSDVLLTQEPISPSPSSPSPSSHRR